MNIIDNIERNEAQSVTAAVCENAALYGAAPERDEFDTRDVWDADDAIDAVLESFRILSPKASVRTAPSSATSARAWLVGLRQHDRQPRPSASTAPPTS